MADVRVRLSHFYRDKKPGDEVSVSVEEAGRLVRSGLARPATVVEARKADVPEETAATKQKK